MHREACHHLWWPPMAAVTKCPRLGGCNNRKVFSHHSGSQCPRLKGQQGRFLLRPFSLACRWPAFLCPSFCACLRPNPLFLQGHQSYWTRAHPGDLMSI